MTVEAGNGGGSAGANGGATQQATRQKAATTPESGCAGPNATANGDGDATTQQDQA